MGIFLVTPLTPFATAAGAAFNTFTTRQDVSPKPLPVIQGGTLQIGSVIKIEAEGEFTTTATPTLSVGVHFGPVSGTPIPSNGFWEYTAATVPSAATAWPWRLEWRGKVLGALGTTCSILGMGEIELGTSLTAVGAIQIPSTAALRTVAVYDSTIANGWGICAAWSASNASNSITVNNITAMLIYGP